MRLVPFLVSGVVTAALVIVLNQPWGSIPPAGPFFSPQQGFWQNAEPADQSYNIKLHSPQLRDSVSVYFDEYLVPHVFARNDFDLYFVQGYLHAKFRLWQMEFQTHAAAGRLAEILGAGPDSAILQNDRNMRRLGMVYAAKNSLQLMEEDTLTKNVLDAYTAGVNHFIGNMKNGDLPLEYRLLNYKPEPWQNLKTVLFLKYMSYDLTGEENDLEYTNAKAVLNKKMFDLMYPMQQDSLVPIIPKGTLFHAPELKSVPPALADSVYFQWKDSAGVTPTHQPDKNNGSNNWAVNGNKTQSGFPMLCSDPHLGLNLPSLWFEMQLHLPDHSAYGVSFPGAPAIIIGYTEQVAWGVTNASRDVKDYYSIRFRDDTHQEYWFNGEWKKAQQQIETYQIKGGGWITDTVAYTLFGPVQYDRSFAGAQKRAAHAPDLAVRWKAHDASNELKTFYLLNRAVNYGDYIQAIKHFTCPGQNFVFASYENNIAIWQQGEFPAKWRRQGDFIMPGTDSTYMWQRTIPQNENPHLFNPERGYVSSANQLPADTTYPYYLGGDYDLYRGFIINRKLQEMNGITVDDMKQLQTDNYNVFAEKAMPVLLKYIQENRLSPTEKKYLDIVRNWKWRNDPAEKGATIFRIWEKTLDYEVWSDELSAAPQPIQMPREYTLVEAMIRDTAFPFLDNITTPVQETIGDVITAAFQKGVTELTKLDEQGRLEWSVYKDSGIRHLLRLGALSRFHLTTGGGKHIINATDGFHGPSWRMVVHLNGKQEAYGVYPGGQQGNAGSKYYDSFINDWAAGKYHPLWMMKEDDKNDRRIRYRMQCSK